MRKWLDFLTLSELIEPAQAAQLSNHFYCFHNTQLEMHLFDDLISDTTLVKERVIDHEHWNDRSSNLLFFFIENISKSRPPNFKVCVLSLRYNCSPRECGKIDQLLLRDWTNQTFGTILAMVPLYQAG